LAEVILRAPLSELCGGRLHTFPGETVLSVLQELESAHPAVAGWILDERAQIREHVNVFVNGEHGDETTQVRTTDRVHVLPAITGG
jgi:molybdopterin synthase sulfur carrier subunit